MGRVIPALGLSLAVAVGCAGRSPRPERAALRVVAQPENASVYIDGRYFGSARALSRHPKTLSLGKHLVTIEAPDHFPHDFEVDLPSGTSTVRVSLRPVPP